MLLSFCSWLEDTSIGTSIREGALLYPVIGGIHLLAIALFGGMILAADIRLLGWGLAGLNLSDLISKLRVWKWLGGVVVTITGLLLAWCEPLKLYHSPSFWIKITLLALVGVHAVAFRSIYRHPEGIEKCSPARARLAGGLSLLLWIGIVVSGRLIAFDS